MISWSKVSSVCSSSPTERNVGSSPCASFVLGFLPSEEDFWPNRREAQQPWPARCRSPWLGPRETLSRAVLGVCTRQRHRSGGWAGVGTHLSTGNRLGAWWSRFRLGGIGSVRSVLTPSRDCASHRVDRNG